MAHTTRREAQSSFNQSAEALQNLPIEAVHAIRDLARQVRDETLELVQAGRDQVSDMGDRADGIIRGNHWPAVCIAAGVGLILGLTMRRR